MMQFITRVDEKIIAWSKRMAHPAARFALFVIFFWFGFIKILGLSPAEQLVEDLFNRTIHFMPFGTFYLLFSLFECLIGILFLIPKATRLVIAFLAFHMVTTIMPLFLLTQVTWQSFLVPTLEGQYIIKNLALIALAIGIAGDTVPLKQKA